MELSKQVCTLEQAKRLKELGVAQVSLFHWWWLLKDPGEKGPHIAYQSKVISTGTLSNRQECCAYTVAELGEMLPQGYHTYNSELGKDKWGAMNADDEDFALTEGTSLYAETEAQARAAMLIHLLESKLLTIEDVNKRLQQ